MHPLAALAVPLLLLATACSSPEEPSAQPDATSAAPSVSPSPSPDGAVAEDGTRERSAGPGVARTARLTQAAASSYGELLDSYAADHDGRLPGEERAAALFEDADFRPVLFLEAIVLNDARTGYSFCVTARNEKSSAILTGGRGRLAVLEPGVCTRGSVTPASTR